MSFVDSRVSCIADEIVSWTQNAATCDYQGTSIIQSCCNDMANQSATFYLVNIVTARFRRNPRDDLARKKARNTCWNGVFTREESSQIPDYESFDQSWRPWRNLRARSIRVGALVRRIRYGGVLIGCCRNSVNAYVWSSAK